MKSTKSTPIPKGDLFDFITNVCSRIDAFKKGDKINRKEVAEDCNGLLKGDGTLLPPSDAESLVGIILRSRKDIETRKGAKTGGTFKL